MSARQAASHGVAGVLLAAAPLAAFLHNNDYALLSPEGGVLLAACLALGALIALIAALRPLFAAFALGAGAALCLDLLYGPRLSGPALLVLALACLGLALALRRHIAPVISASAFVFVATTLAIPSTVADDAAHARGGAPAAKALPVVLHLILDEHIGLRGLPTELPETVELERTLAGDYTGAGFRVYAGAYSEYVDTRNSLANLLNFTSEDGAWAHLAEGRAKPYVLTDSAYFKHLSRLGYQLHVYESDHIELCRVPGVPYAQCVQYRANSIGALKGAPLGAAQRLRFILNSFMETSSYLVTLRAAYARARRFVPLPAWEAGASRVGPLAVLPTIDRLERELRSGSRGQAYVAHLLIPHYPYVLDESCAPRERVDHWLYNVPAAATEAAGNSAESRARRYRHYAAQVRCQQALLGRLFRAMKDAGTWDDAIVLVHGDHGSRIFRTSPVARNAARLTQSDLRDGFSTLFAVRKPGVEPGVVPEPRPLQELLAEAFDVPMKPLSPKVYLRAGPDQPFSRLAVPFSRH